jgi:hypothetical protein
MLAVIFDRIGKQVDHHLLDSGSIRIGNAGVFKWKEVYPDVALLRLRFDQGLAFAHGLGQRHWF